MSKYTTKCTWLGKEYGCRVFYDGQLVVEGRLKQLWKDKIPECMWNDYTPTSNAIAINQERINQRLTTMKGK